VVHEENSSILPFPVPFSVALSIPFMLNLTTDVLHTTPQSMKDNADRIQNLSLSNAEAFSFVSFFCKMNLRLTELQCVVTALQ
jgi:hypothetical protein